MRRLAAILTIVLLSGVIPAQEKIKPGTVHNPKTPAFDCYRSFKKELETTKYFAEELGINTRCFFASNTINGRGEWYCEYPPIWISPGQYDWENFDAQVDDLLKYSPNARFLCMIDLNTPYWAARKYGMDSFHGVSHLGFNEKWLSETTVWMEAFIEHAQGRYSDKIFAYILSGGGTSEWYESFNASGYSSPHKDKGWREWCSRHGLRYGSSAPSYERMFSASFEGVVYDPCVDGCAIDFWRYSSESTANAILHFSARARKILPADTQVGVFFGYYFIRGLKEVTFGHSAYEQVFASPDIDFFIAPASYTNRKIGEGTGSQMVVGSAMINGKRHLHEIDFTPHDYSITTFNPNFNSLEEDLAGNKREACFAIINHSNLWWFDMWGHFYDAQPLREVIGATHRIFERFKDDNSPSVSQVLYLADPGSNYYYNDKKPNVSNYCNEFRKKMLKTGFPSDVYTFSDIDRLDLSQYKVVCIPAMVEITPEKEKMLKEYLCKDSRTILWCYAPGLTDGKALSSERVEKWAGVPYKTPGITKTDMGDWTAVYAWNYEDYTAESLRDICLEAGVHRYVEEDIPVFANERLLCIHCKEGGEKTVSLPRKALKVVELFTGKEVTHKSKSFKYDFKSPDTALFEIIYR